MGFDLEKNAFPNSIFIKNGSNEIWGYYFIEDTCEPDVLEIYFFYGDFTKKFGVDGHIEEKFSVDYIAEEIKHKIQGLFLTNYLVFDYRQFFNIYSKDKKKILSEIKGVYPSLYEEMEEAIIKIEKKISQEFHKINIDFLIKKIG